jgi:hypothetical protein
MQVAPRDAVQQKASSYVRKVGRVEDDDLRKHLYDEGVSPDDAKRVMIEELVAIELTPYTRKTEPYFFKFPNIGSVSPTSWTGYKLPSYDYDILVEEHHPPGKTDLSSDVISRTYILL